MLRIIFFFLSVFCAQAQSLPKMVFVKGGTYKRTYLNEEDKTLTQKVTLSSFYIATTEVTVVQYRQYCKETKTSMPEEPYWGWQDNYPIVNVNWYDAKKYCKWLRKKTGKRYNIPTEAQWEYAAIGGKLSNNYIFSGSNDVNTVAWYKYNSNNQPHAVASKKPNELGLYDMTGNVWEWCLDWYDPNYYSISRNKNPKNTKKTQYKVLRGGSWFVKEPDIRLDYRYRFVPRNRFINRGFRVVHK